MHIHEKYNLGWLDSTARMVYIDLKGNEDYYSLVQDEKTFEYRNAYNKYPYL